MYRVFDSSYILAITLSLFLIFAAGCSDDDNPAGGDPTDEGHMRAVGIMLIHGSDTLVTADGTVVTGEIHVHHEDTLGPCVVWFLDPDSGWYHPVEEAQSSLDHDHELQIDVTDGATVSVILGEAVAGADPWSAYFVGVQHGETSIRVKILHLDHPDYTSPLLPVHVPDHEHFAAVGVMLIQEGDTLVTVNGSQIDGRLTVPLGSNSPLIEVWFLDPDGEWVRPEHDHRDSPDEETLELNVEAQNPDLMTITLGEDIPGNEDHWSFIASGSAAGTTNTRILVIHGDHADFTSPWIPTDVVE